MFKKLTKEESKYTSTVVHGGIHNFLDFLIKLEGSWKPLIFDFPHFNWINEMLFCEEKTKSFPSNYFFFGVDRKEGMCQAESEQERSRNPLGKTML